MTKATDDELLQRTEWRRRLVEAVISRKFDDETLVTMLMAGLEQAHEEGISDAADICGKVAKQEPTATRVARVLETSLRKLIVLNKNIVPVL